ncbi:PRA1 family protein B4 [Tanacetum coccineum]
MMSSSPAILPITNQTSESQAPVASLAFREFINNIRETVKSSLLTHRPWFSLLTIVGSVLILALMIVVAVVLAHGTFRIPEDLFLDEQDPTASTGFFVFP